MWGFLCFLCFIVVIDGSEVVLSKSFVIEASKSKHEYLRDGLISRGWRESKRGSSRSFGFKWDQKFVENTKNDAFLNHFRNFEQFTTKETFTQCIRGSDSWRSFFPRSYLNDERDGLFADVERTAGFCDNQTVTFGEEGERNVQQSIDCGSGGRLWIAKPSSGTRGVGIKFFSNAEALKQFLGTTTKSFVVQKYVENPLLVFSRKFDLRLFVLIVSLDPLVVFLNRDCYVRFSGVPYDSNSPDLFVHLTNAQVQKYNKKTEEQEAKDNEKGIFKNQWGLKSLAKHLEEKFGEGTWENVVFPRIKKMVKEICLAWPDKKLNHRQKSFELLGLDILLDESLNPWILEVNANPGLHLIAPVVNEHHKRAVEGILKVVLDERERWEGREVQELFIDPFEILINQKKA